MSQYTRLYCDSRVSIAIHKFVSQYTVVYCDRQGHEAAGALFEHCSQKKNRKKNNKFF